MQLDVIIPAHNPNPSFISQAILSAKNQTWKGRKNIIVVDDGSTYDIRPYIHDAKYIRQDNLGPAAARNTAIKNSNSEYISLLDADDIWDQNKITNQLKYMESGSALICGNYRIQTATSLREPFYKTKPTINYNSMMRVNFVASGSTTFSREAINKVGLFNENYWIAEDYDLWLRIAEHYPIDYIHKVLYYYRVQVKNSLTQRNDIQAKHISNINKIREESKRRKSLETSHN